MKNIKRFLSIVLIIAIIITGIYIYRNFKFQHKAETLSSNIEETISNISELSIVKYNYTDLAEFSDNIEFSGINIPFTQKTFLVKYSGYIKAGLPAEKIKIEVVDSKKAIVTLGDLEILDNVIMEEEVYFYNEKDSTFNRIKLDDLYDILKREKKNKEKEAIDRGLLIDGKKNLENLLKLQLQEIGFEEIVFKDI